MGYNGYIFLSVLAGAGLGYALFGESIANAKIQSVKIKAAMMSCGDCQGEQYQSFLHPLKCLLSYLKILKSTKSYHGFFYSS